MSTAAPDSFASTLLYASDTEEVRVALQSFGAVVSDVGGVLGEALNGDYEATRRYVSSYRRLTGTLLAAVHATRPDIVVDVGDDRLAIMDAKGHPSQRALIGVLENASAEAPFTTWVTHFELADAIALDLTSRVRTLIGAVGLQTPPEVPTLVVDDVAAAVFQRRVRHHLNHPEDQNPLLRLMEVFALSKTELGRLFGVSRQAVDSWIGARVPADRQEKLSTMLSLADLLERKLKAGRVAGVARRPADAYDGKTMLDLISEDRHQWLLESTRDAFDWSQPA
jgi:hypothetical protein